MAFGKGFYIFGMIIGILFFLWAILNFIFEFWAHSLIYYLAQILVGTAITIRSFIEYRKLSK